jgi:hypothetical protein
MRAMHPSGPDDLKMIRDRGYVERTIVLSSPSKMSVLTESNASGVDRVVKVPVKINGRYDLGELRSTVKPCLQNHAASARPTDHGAIAQRPYELYEAGVRHEAPIFSTGSRLSETSPCDSGFDRPTILRAD